MLPNDDTGAKDLLYFLGCLPGGIRNDWLSQMWDMTAMQRDLSLLLSRELIDKQ